MDRISAQGDVTKLYTAMHGVLGPYTWDSFWGSRLPCLLAYHPFLNDDLDRKFRGIIPSLAAHTTSCPLSVKTNPPLPIAFMYSAASTSKHVISAWPPEPIPPPESLPQPPAGYLSRKALPIKRNDAEPLTREDVQYDFLTYLFTNSTKAFTKPNAGKRERVTFGDLYISALYSSGRCSKVLKDKMQDTPAFSVEFAKLALLTNVGRINTTMAFFPEMKTALRTYHPVPSLQKTDGNAQDAPRIKNCLKAALLPSELNTPPPSNPDEVLHRLRGGLRPPTTVVNLIFVLANHAAPLSAVHFDGNLNFLDLFLPNTYLSSGDRAKAFLWLMYYYLESATGPNPFDDSYSSRHPGKIPTLRRLTKAEYQRENVDTQEEIEWGQNMTHQRNVFLQKLVVEADKKGRPHAHYVTESGNNMPRSQRQLLDEPSDERSFLFYVPSQENSEPQRPQKVYHRSRSEGERTMFQQAWHIVKTLDPLDDSDDEEITDYNMHVDIARRLEVITRIRTQPATPTPL